MRMLDRWIDIPMHRGLSICVDIMSSLTPLQLPVLLVRALANEPNSKLLATPHPGVPQRK